MAFEGLNFGPGLQAYGNMISQGRQDELALEREQQARDQQMHLSQMQDQRAREMQGLLFDQQRVLEGAKAVDAIKLARAKGELAGQRADQTALNRQSENLKNDLDPNKARGGNLAKSQAMINSAERVQGLLSQFPDGNVPAAQTMELATAVAGLVGGGSAQSQQQINHIVPSTISGDANAIAAWVTNNPRGQGQQQFIKLMGETSKRERDIALEQVQRAQVQRLSAYGKFRQSSPDEYNQIISAYGLTPETVQRFSPGGQPTPSQGAGQAPMVAHIEIPDDIVDPDVASVLKEQLATPGLTHKQQDKLMQNARTLQQTQLGKK